MALSKWKRATLKALSYPDIDVRKHYIIQRKIIDVANRHVIRPFYKIWDHVIDAGDHEVPVRIFSPRIKGLFPVLLFFHGGGWVTGNIDSYDRICTQLAAKTKHHVVSVDYRLAPEYKFPAGLQDCYLAAHEIFMSPELLGIDANQITLIGDSAGGNLAAAVSLMARDNGAFYPRRQILLYPSAYNIHDERSPYPSVIENGTDYLLTSKRVDEYLELYKSCEQDLTNPYLAPLLADNLANQPDTLVITAEYDPLRDEGEAYGHALRAAGNRVQIHRISDALHGFMSLSPRNEHVQQAYEHINRFIRQP